MRCSGWLAVACGLAALTAIDVERAAGAVAIGATSATVQNAGDTAQICIVMQTTGGEQVAGTQNDLTWDGNCAILANSSDCQVAGTHGKQLSGTLYPQGQDFSFRGLILSFSDTQPIPNGPLYCCNFIGEADPGQCCNITVMNTDASDSKGGKVPAMGNTAKLCTAASSDNNPARPPMGGGMNAPLSASNEAPPAAGGSGSTSSAPQPAANTGASAPPPAQVLPGGGARVENPGGPAAPPIQAPMTPGLPQVPAQPPAGAPAAVAPGAVPPAAGAAPAAAATVAAPTVAPTKAAATPPPADTPTARAPAATQAAPATKAAPAAAKAANSADPPAAASNRGLFGCEVSGAPSGMPFLALGVLALIGRAVVRRRRR